MRYHIAAALIALLPVAARAQSTDHGAHHRVAADSVHMQSPCPLHLETLGLTPVQDSALRAIRAAHMAELRAVRARLGVAHDDHPTSGPLADAMKASMTRALDGVRATLDDAQRAKLGAAVKDHDAEKTRLAAEGRPHDCAKCCEKAHPEKAKRES